METDLKPDQNIIWPSHIKAKPEWSYRSLELLYNEKKCETTGNKFALIVACARSKPTYDANDPMGVVHKVEIDAMPNVAKARIEITHEVCPGLKEPTEIVTVNNELRAVGFTNGSVVQVSNFGPKKTFNCDVRGRHDYHIGEVTCLSANSAGTQLATACSSGSIALYQAREAEMELLTDNKESRFDHITAMSYFKPSSKFVYGRTNTTSYEYDQLLLYTSIDGQLALLDSRCRLAERVYNELMMRPEPRLSITSMATIQSKSDNVVYLGGLEGELIGCDLRQKNKVIHKQRMVSDGCIEKLKEVVLVDSNNKQRTFLAYTNSSKNLKIIDLETMKPCANWICERNPDEVIRDFVQVEDRLITCGDKTTIGSWIWDRPIKSTD